MRVMILALALALAADAAEGPVQKIFELKHKEVGAIQPLLNAFPVKIYGINNSRTFAVSGSPEAIAAVGEALKTLDVPAPPEKNIDLTVYMITAGEQPGGKLPPELEPVVKQLRGVFSYTAYSLLESFQLRMRDGDGGESSGFAPAPIQSQTLAGGPKTLYQCRIGQAHIAPADKGATIRLNRVHFGLKVPTPASVGSNSASFTYNDVGISTAIDIREGQKVVVGKANVTGAEKSAFIFVVTARVVD